jgi:hypothetical protein
MKILWRVVTRFHDWNDLHYPSRLIDSAAATGAIGPVTWVITRQNAARRDMNISRANMGVQLMGQVRRHDNVLFLEAGGDGWDLLLVVPPFVQATNRLNGIGVLVLFFDRPALEQEAGSEQLWNGFRATHTPDDTEYAAIHPEDRWNQLRRTAYNPAVTYDPIFAGAAWANFLGPGHVEQFDCSALETVQAEWVDRGVFFRDPGPLGEVTSPTAEARLFAVTAAFRRALRS